jgi:hypothetical protein
VSLGLILLIVLIVLLAGGVPTGFYGRGPYLGGGLGLVLLIVLILILMGRL